MILENKTILITGGAGYLGRALIRRLYQKNKLIVFSRDEAKHYYLAQEFPNIDFYVGDVGNYDDLDRVARENNINVGIFCASLKQIEACDANHEYAMKTILGGAINSRKIAERYHFEAACYVSSDKACSPVTYYGQLKAAAENAFTYPSKRKNTNKNFVRLSACRYGNVVSSTGSIFCLMNEAVKKKYPLTLFSNEMTRFYMDVEQSVDLILDSLFYSNEIIVPYLQSYLIKDSFDLYVDKFGLKYSLGSPRPNEKIHEVMISSEELPRTIQVNDDAKKYFRITPFVQGGQKTFVKEYSSKNVVISKDKLFNFLESKNWFNISI